MCKVLNIPRSSYYYDAKQKTTGDNLASEIREIFRQSRNNYGTRKIKVGLFNREIIGYSAGRNKDAALVSKAFSRVNVNLDKIQIFHTDRGNEFKNKLLDETLEQLQYELSDYVNWFNNHRIHSSLGYLTPKEYRLTNLKKIV